MREKSIERAVNIECLEVPLAAEYMRRAGIRVYEEKCTTERQLRERLQGHDTLVHYFTDRPIPISILEETSIKRIVVAGPAAGCFENMDAFRSGKLDIYDTPAQAVTSVAEYTVSLLMMLAKNLRPTLQDMEKGLWVKTVNTQLAGKSVGLIGFGEVSKQVAKLCRGIGLRVFVAANRDKREEVMNTGYRFVSLDELLTSCDFVSIHKRLTQDTYRLLNGEKLQLMKPHACLINTSRAEIVDTNSVLRMLEEGAMAGAAMDVFDKEPLCNSSELRVHRNVIATPHNAWLTEEAVANMVSVAVSAIRGDVTLARRVH